MRTGLFIGLLALTTACAAPNPTARLSMVTDLSTVGRYADAFRDVCLLTASNAFSGYEEMATKTGYKRIGQGIYSDGNSVIKVDTSQFQGRTIGSCTLSVKLPRDDELIKEYQRVVNETGLASGPPSSGGVFGRSYFVPSQQIVIGLGRNSLSEPTDLRVSIGVNIGDGLG